MRSANGRWLFVVGTYCLVALGVLATVSMTAHARLGDNTLRMRSLLGSYLAGRLARTQNESDYAVEFYRAALRRSPDNIVLMEQGLAAEASEGNFARAEEIAHRLIRKRPENRLARMLLALVAFKDGSYKTAARHFKSAASDPIGDLTSVIGRAWSQIGRGDSRRAIQLLKTNSNADWSNFYLSYHRALMADLSGRKELAQREFEKVFKRDGRTLRTALAYAHYAARNKDRALARTILKLHTEKTQNDPHPLVKDFLARLDNKKEKFKPMVGDASEGMAEVLYGLGEALVAEGGVNVGITYLQMALYLEPKHPFALAALANAYETVKRYERANQSYDRIPANTPLQVAIEVRKALNLNYLDKVDEAKTVLEGVMARDPSDIRSFEALANIMRSRKRYREAIDYYTKAIALLGKPQKRHWAYYYSRGTCYERIKDWPPAEADLKKALELSPNRPLVLNYLGYSWIDQNNNLQEGLALIEKAVNLRPEDGYIVDSLGWAHYKLGNFTQAVRYLEKAVELKPEDPILNDHLGDAFWRVNRDREARFQWSHALTLLDPEDPDTPKRKKEITNKLAVGLPVFRAPKVNTQANASSSKKSVRQRATQRNISTDVPLPDRPSNLR